MPELNLAPAKVSKLDGLPEENEAMASKSISLSCEPIRTTLSIFKSPCMSCRECRCPIASPTDLAILRVSFGEGRSASKMFFKLRSATWRFRFGDDHDNVGEIRVGKRYGEINVTPLTQEY